MNTATTVADVATNPFWLLVTTAIAGSTGYAVRAWFQKKLVRAEAIEKEATAAQVISKTAAELVNPLRLELATVRDEMEAVRAKLAACQVQAINLSDQLQAMTRKNEELLMRNAELERGRQP